MKIGKIQRPHIVFYTPNTLPSLTFNDDGGSERLEWQGQNSPAFLPTALEFRDSYTPQNLVKMRFSQQSGFWAIRGLEHLVMIATRGSSSLILTK